MKKTYDWDIRLWVKVGQRRVELVASAHTNIHQLKMALARQLKVSPLDSQIDFYHGSDQPLKPVSTLIQNEVANHDTLVAHVKRSVTDSDLQQAQSEAAKTKGEWNKAGVGAVERSGLRVVACCTNPQCVNHSRDVEIDFGMGSFAILELTADSKCQLCPYRSQHLRPSMMCKKVSVAHCHYRLKGRVFDQTIPVEKDSGYLRAKGEADIGKFLRERPWHSGMILIVKPL